MQTSKKKSLIYVCYRQVCYFDIFDSRVRYLSNSWEELLLLYSSKNIWWFYFSTKLFENYLSKRRWALSAWWINVKHAKQGEIENCLSKIKSKIKEFGIWKKRNKVNTPTLKWVLFSTLFINFLVQNCMDQLRSSPDLALWKVFL